ncbi:MAG: trigger factor [Actinobacteria bacterium]|nr:trigger factor [Actinomycetota bacterium]
MRSVKSIIETLEGNKVKLSVEIDEVEFDRNIDKAFRKIANEIRIPGFRQGKAPRQLLQAQIGLGAARSQAIQDSIPEYLALAVREHDVDLIATPQIEVTKGEEEGILGFDATCEVRPIVTVPGYNGLRIELPALLVKEEDVDDAMKSERSRHGVLKDVDRAIAKGDHVSLDLSGTREGTPVPGLNVEDWAYEVGKGWVSASFDEKLTGEKLGSTITYSEAPNGTTDIAEMTVVVKKVQEMVLDDLTDEWVAEHVSEFETVDAWKASLRKRLEEIKLNQTRSVFVERTTAALAELVTIDIPEAMIASDLQARVRNTVEQFQSQGVSIDQWLSATGQTTESFIENLRTESQKAVKVDLALRAVAVAQAISASDDDIEQELVRIAMQVGRKVNQVRKAYQENDALTELAAQIHKSQAVDWLLRNSTLVDPEGNAINADDLFGDESQGNSTE